MFKIVGKQDLVPEVVRLDVQAPRIARRHRAGQFVILRVHEHSERIPLTVTDTDLENGTIVLIIQGIGKSTLDMCSLQPGDAILDVVGPLGKPTHIEKFGRVVCVAGGIGIAPLYPITRALKAAGNHITAIVGARSKDLYILKEEMESISDRILYTTDDGSFGRKGFVTTALGDLMNEGEAIDLVIAIGPAVMMKAVSDLTRPARILTYVSLNSIMVDGTGMCGACRVSVGGATRFVCVDGPEFDGHQVDFKELLTRQSMYLEEEKLALAHAAGKTSCQGGGTCR